MRVNSIRCDRCGANGAEETVGITVGRRQDAAGSMEDIDLVADLCTACQASLFKHLIKNLHAQTGDVEFFLRQLVSSPSSHTTRRNVFVEC